MVFNIPSLQAFVEPVPCCLATTRLTAALAMLKQVAGRAEMAAGSHRLVLVDDCQHPLGWVSVQQLLSYCATGGLLDQWSGGADDRPLAVEPLVVDQALGDVLSSMVEPLVVVAADLAIDAFLPRLRTQSHVCYAVVDGEGHFLGLLDSLRLLQFLTTRTTAKIEMTPAITVPSPPLLSPLLRELLESLPLPVMLQTFDGQVLVQNAIWRTQIGELLDPGWVQHEVATLLELPLVETTAETAAALPPPSDRDMRLSLESSATSQSAGWAARLHPLTLESQVSPETPYQEDDGLGYGNAGMAGVFPGASACQLGTKPGTCICVCQLKDGQEQILQFVRVPLRSLAAQTALQLGNEAPTLVSAVETLLDETLLSQESASPSYFFQRSTPLPTLHHEVDPVSERSRSSRSAASVVTESEELWLILAQDVTEQQQLARELTAKNADLIQLNRLKDEFLACISHELRTPLTAVLGLSSLLKDQTLGALNERQVYYARLIHQSGRHLMAVVNDILDLTRMETGQLELVLAPVELETVCRRAFEQAQQLRHQESCQAGMDSEPGTAVDEPMFSLALEPELGLLIADEQRLRQMLVHLLSNALKFTESHDPIGLKVTRWGGWIALTVWDTGIGIPAEKQHLIFQKFQQLENPLTRQFEGTGLGLVLTQRLARLHGGDITFVSKEGEGSQFTLLLPPNLPGSEASCTLMPAAPSAAAASQRGRSPQVYGKPPAAMGNYALDAVLPRSQLVLIVEASPHSLETLSDQLTGLGYRVVIARSGTEALEKARRLQPCLIFLNPVLPLLSGWDVLTLLKANAETQQLPVVIMATKVDEQQSRQRQSEYWLSVPIQPKALQKCLQTLVVDRQAKLHPQPTAPLTILRLSPGIWANQHQPIPTVALNALLHSSHCRILEADDLEQAELLARVWKPNVVLLDGVIANAVAYFQQYSQHIFLASLPLVTIDPTTAQAANQVPGLLVFPCLSTPEAEMPLSRAMTTNVETSALLQVIQVAVGYTWRPSILALDAPLLPRSLLQSSGEPTPPDASARGLHSLPQETAWLQALMQYLNTAGLRGVVGRCWQEVLQQLESHSVDVLIICWTDTIAQPFTTPMLLAIQQLRQCPPILVLDHRAPYQDTSQSIAPLPDVLRQMATQILPASLSMSELLQHMHQVMKAHQQRER